MSDQQANGAPVEPAPGIDLGDFHWQSVDAKLNQTVDHIPDQQFRAVAADSQRVVTHDAQHAAPPVPKAAPLPPLGTIKAFKGRFGGRGFNLIFRPRSNNFNDFPTPRDPGLLEATWQRAEPRPGRAQDDIFLNGVTYLQLVDDITDPVTGKANPEKHANIHAEPGVWIHVPESKVNPKLGASLCRMASIPHGTTINAQCLDTPIEVNGPPRFAVRDPQPFLIGSPTGRKFPFDSLDISKQNTARIPQDLSLFNSEGTITDETLRDVNSVLRNHIRGQKITHTTVFTVATNPPITDLAGGVANIGFLRGDGVLNATTGVNEFKTPNADAVQMEAEFWIETVETTVHIPAMKAGQQPARLVPDKGPLVIVQPPEEGETGKRDEKLIFTQIQYSQLVLLNFGGLSWPHISVATLVPEKVKLQA